MIDASTASVEEISEAIARGGRHTCGFVTGARAAALAATLALAGCEKQEVKDEFIKGTLPAPHGEQVAEIEGREFPIAEQIAERQGWVVSPYTGNHVLVVGIPTGALVNDPSFPMQEEKYFRVPEEPESGETKE
jgi:hypothetical protein